jgi:hypothetical protein
MSQSYGTLTDVVLPDTTIDTINYIKRRLGEPAIQVNVCDEAILDRIGDALQFYRDYNEDGVEKTYISHQVTQEDIDNQYFTVANNVFEVTRVLPPTNIDKNIMTDITYNMRHSINFNEFMMSAYTGAFEEYSLMMMKIQEINDMFVGAKTTDFNRFTHRLYWRQKLQDQFSVGDYFVYEAYVIVDPAIYGGVFTDRRFLSLATAYVKKEWGDILSKFADVPLLGGVKLNADKISLQADKEIEKAEQDIITSSKPAMDFIG